MSPFLLLLALLQDASGVAEPPLASSTELGETRDEQNAAETERPSSALLYEGALLGAADATDFDETNGYRRLIEIAERYSDADLAARAERRLDIASAMAHSDEWRGEILRVRGLILDVRPERLGRPIDAHEDVYRALVVEPDASEGVVVDFLEKPPELELERDVVEFEGIFFRTVRYESRRGTPREAPYLIARSIRRLDPDGLKRETRFDTFALLLVGAATAFLLIRIVNSMRSLPRRPRGDDRDSRLLRERAQAALRTPASKT